MPVFKTSRRLAVSPEIAYAVAADVSAYQEFLPLLQRSNIRGRKLKTPQGEQFDAELAVTYPKLGLAESFISHVQTDAAARRVTARSTDAPFNSIETQWQITAAETGCDVSILIDYSFRNPFLQVAASGLMDMATSKIMSAFEIRALDVQRAASNNS
jgi:coenzyme Q-binding protein COQ10